MNKKLLLAIITVALVLLLPGCGSSSDGGGGRDGKTITGSITGGTNQKVGLFNADIHWFYNDGSGDPDEITDQSDIASEPYVAEVLGTIDTGTYSIEMPPGVSLASYYLIAWDDTDDDGFFSLSTEFGYFPVKDFPEGTLEVRYISWLEFIAPYEWAVGYYDGATNYLIGFSNSGQTGYNFLID